MSSNLQLSIRKEYEEIPWATDVVLAWLTKLEVPAFVRMVAASAIEELSAYFIPSGHDSKASTIQVDVEVRILGSEREISVKVSAESDLASPWQSDMGDDGTGQTDTGPSRLIKLADSTDFSVEGKLRRATVRKSYR